MKPRCPSEPQIVDALHDAAAECGDYDDAECIATALRVLTPADAGDDAREAISAAVRRVWTDRFVLWGGF